jgi:uncharacterized coiled-coil protein SlyX
VTSVAATTEVNMDERHGTLEQRVHELEALVEDQRDDLAHLARELDYLRARLSMMENAMAAAAALFIEASGASSWPLETAQPS